MENTANFLDISMLRNGDLELKWEIRPRQGVNYLLKLNILISELSELNVQANEYEYYPYRIDYCRGGFYARP